MQGEGRQARDGGQSTVDGSRAVMHHQRSSHLGGQTEPHHRIVQRPHWQGTRRAEREDGLDDLDPSDQQQLRPQLHADPGREPRVTPSACEQDQQRAHDQQDGQVRQSDQTVAGAVARVQRHTHCTVRERHAQHRLQECRPARLSDGRASW